MPSQVFFLKFKIFVTLNILFLIVLLAFDLYRNLFTNIHANLLEFIAIILLTVTVQCCDNSFCNSTFKKNGCLRLW